MSTISRRGFLGLAGKAAAGGAALSAFPAVLYRSSWVQAAAAQTPPNVEVDFVALVEVVNDADDDTVPDVARWIIAEFDKALPPLPEGSPSTAVAAILDAYAVHGGHGLTFASSSTEGRRGVLEALVEDEDPAMRQLANQILPYASFAYWGDVALGEPARPGGERPTQWEHAGFLGPSHGRLDTYLHGLPPGFSASAHEEGR